MIYHDIVNIAKEKAWPTQYEMTARGRSLKMVGKTVPVSIMINEFNFIKDFIIRHDLKTGYEVATAFGASSLAAGLAFKDTGGKLVTIDCYLEEEANSDTAYFNKRGIYENAHECMGYKSANNLINHFDVPVATHIGFSPDDVETTLSEHYNLTQDKLEYVFIDAAHHDEALKADLEVVRPYLADNFVVFIHDLHCFSTEVIEGLGKSLGSTCRICKGCRLEEGDGFNLSYITDME